MAQKKIRKPKDLKTKDCYTGFGESNDEVIVYIGGPYYLDSSQIHIKDVEDVHKLAEWLAKASAYLRNNTGRK